MQGNDKFSWQVDNIILQLHFTAFRCNTSDRDAISLFHNKDNSGIGEWNRNENVSDNESLIWPLKTLQPGDACMRPLNRSLIKAVTSCLFGATLIQTTNADLHQ